MSKLLNALLSALADEIDITESQHGAIKRAYNSVADWLNENGTDISAYKIHIFPQGSMMYGTAIKPIEEEDYDIDLVCELTSSTQGKSAEFIKKVVGNRIREHAKYRTLLQPEGRRCWTLQYSENLNFHIDILPAIPFAPEHKSDLRLNEAYESMGERKKLALLATDKNKATLRYTFIPTNPRGYAEWFKERTQFNRTVMRFESIERVPDYPKKTVLQKGIQLLKRHRDVFFADDDSDVKPISMILTTLLAHSYNGESDIYEFICNALNKLETFIEKDNNGYYVIKNPVMPSENFADKWKETPQKADVFFKWLNQAKQDFKQLGQVSSYVEFDCSLKALFAQKPVDRLMLKYKKELEQERNRQLATTAGVSTLTAYESIPHRVAPPWVLPNGYRVSIKAEISLDGGKTYQEFSSGELLPKHAQLQFFAIHSLHGKLTVKWQVTNTGTEARLKQGLRGNKFEASELTRFGRLCGKSEYTEYTGTHYIQCFVIKNGNQCMGKSIPFVVKIR